MSKFKKGQKVIVINNPQNQKRGKTRIGIIVGAEKKPIMVMITGELDLRPTEPTYRQLYSVQIIENDEETNNYGNILYGLFESDLMAYSEIAEQLYC